MFSREFLLIMKILEKKFIDFHLSEVGLVEVEEIQKMFFLRTEKQNFNNNIYNNKTQQETIYRTIFHKFLIF